MASERTSLFVLPLKCNCMKGKLIWYHAGEVFLLCTAIGWLTSHISLQHAYWANSLCDKALWAPVAEHQSDTAMSPVT